jgi:hypothetical protein
MQRKELTIRKFSQRMLAKEHPKWLLTLPLQSIHIVCQQYLTADDK